MGIKKLRERVHNGGTTGTESDWDTYYYETSEDMVVGQVESLQENGYRQLSGGLILQWGTAVISNSNHSVEGTITLPVEVNKVLNITVSCHDMGNRAVVSTYNLTSKNFKILAQAVMSSQGVGNPVGALRIYWFAICK